MVRLGVYLKRHDGLALGVGSLSDSDVERIAGSAGRKVWSTRSGSGSLGSEDWSRCKVFGTRPRLDSIGTADDLHRKTRFPLLKRKPYDRRMKNNKFIAAALSGVLAIAVTVLSQRASVNAETFVASISVLALLAVAAVDYRINSSRVSSR